MTRQPPTDLAASVRQRLLNIAKAEGTELQLVLARYGVERLLYRLGRSPAAERLVLKGAVLFALWDRALHRPTRDVDFLGSGDPSPDAVAALFRTICSTPAEPDGLSFLPDSVVAGPIRDRQEYGGVRVKLLAMLGMARIPLQIDVGFGDAVTPAPVVATFPTLLPDLPFPIVRAYPPEVVIAEKFHAMVALGMANTRMKDFYDVWLLAETRRFDGPTLASAIAATFERRDTELPARVPPALGDAFGRDAEKQALWQAFLARGRLTPTPSDLPTTLERIAALVMPPARALREGKPLRATWEASIGWADRRPPGR